MAVFLCAPACDTLDDEDYYKLVITSHGDTFIGTYTVDSDIYVIKPSEIEAEGKIHTYSKGLGSLTSLDVDISGDSPVTSFLKIVLYQNKQKVGDKSAGQVDSATIVSLSYTYTASEANRH
ncbi:MAG: hypothetical protein FWG13_02105 [Leptospirales bacterium]|nr:hypothetical protein [Leptospirales bacterium]